MATTDRADIHGSQDAELLDRTRAWWSTNLIDIRPNHIAIKGEPIQNLIGQVSYAGMVWRMLRDEQPSPEQLHLLEAALVAAVDHGPQAPSIAIARMSMTCGTSLNGAMASAINVLDDIHGGAGEQCLQLYESVVNAQEGGTDLSTAIDAVIRQYTQTQGKRLPGFGHRFHAVDPRAVKLLQMMDEAVGNGAIEGRYVAVAKSIEQALSARARKPLPMNIDGVTAAVYGELGFEPALARGLFILSRSVGILAHAWEQKQQGGRIKGPTPPQVGYLYTGRG